MLEDNELHIIPAYKIVEKGLPIRILDIERGVHDKFGSDAVLWYFEYVDRENKLNKAFFNKNLLRFSIHIGDVFLLKSKLDERRHSVIYYPEFTIPETTKQIQNTSK